MKWWFWHSLVTTGTPGRSCSEHWSVECHAHDPHKLIHDPQGSKVIWILFSCFDSTVTIVTSSISCYTHSWFTNKTKLVFQKLFWMFPWVWECTSSSDAGGFIFCECCDMIWLWWCWYSIKSITSCDVVMWFVSLWRNCSELNWCNFMFVKGEFSPSKTSVWKTSLILQCQRILPASHHHEWWMKLF